ncbi:MAG TPA: pitrilysin family protein [Myxococcales bacterium]|nr:pitrilysin family protein [Myxococcales bacterium]
MHIAFVLLILALTASAHAASPSMVATSPVSVPGFTHIRELAGIDEYRLDSNGLEILLKPDHSVPVVAYNVTYRVGSRNEATGTTGATHILEHMMFKGSEHYKKALGNDISHFLEQVGGVYNATTSLDRTNYYEIVGRDSLSGVVPIEADRMRNLLLREEDRRAEMTVVRNEYERGENSPASTLDKEVRASAYEALPYHHSTIGWLSDIENVPIEKLREFYDTFYWPDNATVVIVGDFEPQATLELVTKYYGAYPHAPKPIPQLYTEEPPQTGARRVTVKRPGSLGEVLIAHKVPNVRDADAPAVEVLDTILARGKTSRLYRALIDKNLATSVHAESTDSHDLSLNEIGAQLAPGVRHSEVERTLLAEIERVKEGGVTPDELAIAKRELHTDSVFGRDDAAAIAAELNEWIAVGDWTLYTRYPEAIERVTASDVQRVARQYLNEDQSTTGWFVPVSAK